MMKKVYESPSVEEIIFATESVMVGGLTLGGGLSVTGWGFFDGATENLGQIAD